VLGTYQAAHKALETDRTRMSAVLLMIAQLYAVEKTARRGGLRGENLRLAREHGSRPVLDRLHQYLTVIQAEVLPKSAAGQAVAYALKNWRALTRYCDDGDLSIDNNATDAPFAASLSDETTGLFSTATMAARRRPCFAVSSHRVSWQKSIRSSGSAMFSAASPITSSTNSTTCCPITGHPLRVNLEEKRDYWAAIYFPVTACFGH
jgi:hypothetical protein